MQIVIIIWFFNAGGGERERMRVLWGSVRGGLGEGLLCELKS